MPPVSCFFIGHADAPSGIFPELTACIEHLITQHHVTEFFFGWHGSFDRLVLRALQENKARHPQIRRVLVLAYHPSQLSTALPTSVDESVYPFDGAVPPRFAISKASQKMIQQCDYLIAYVRHTGKARDFLEYAQRKQKRIFTI